MKRVIVVVYEVGEDTNNPNAECSELSSDRIEYLVREYGYLAVGGDTLNYPVSVTAVPEVYEDE